MALDEPASPFGIEQVGEAPRGVLAVDQVGVVTDDAERGAHARVHSVRIEGVGWKVPCGVLRHVRREPAAALPGDEVCRVGAQHDIDRLYATCLFLADALEDALGARPFDPHCNSGIRSLERLGELFGESDVHRRIERDLALPARRLDQDGVDRARLRGGSFDRLGKHGADGERH